MREVASPSAVVLRDSKARPHLTDQQRDRVSYVRCLAYTLSVVFTIALKSGASHLCFS